MKSKRGYIFMFLGVLLVIGAAALSFYNYMDDKRAGEETARVYDSLYDKIEENMQPTDPTSQSDLPVIDTHMKEETIGDRKYIGVVSIPAMNVNLPVQSSLSDEKLRYSPCRYKGDVVNGSLIIAAHNYRTHFGRLGTLKSGDKVIFTDVDGHNYYYKVLEIYHLNSSSVDEMQASGNWDLTLFTCTYGNRQRITVRCIRTEK